MKVVAALLITVGIGAGSTVFGASPETNYLLYCSGCHLPTGVGNPPNVPSLRDELGRMMRVEAMRAYLVQVPGSSQSPMTDADLAGVVNWVLIEFNADTLPTGFQPISVSEVAAARGHTLLDPLKYRSEHWGRGRE